MAEDDLAPPISVTATRTYRRARGSRVPNEARDFSAGILRSEEYKLSVKTRAKNGTLPPAVEQLLWHYAYGKPVDRLEISRPDEAELAGLPYDELAAEAELLAQALRETDAQEKANAPDVNLETAKPIGSVQ